MSLATRADMLPFVVATKGLTFRKPLILLGFLEMATLMGIEPISCQAPISAKTLRKCLIYGTIYTSVYGFELC